MYQERTYRQTVSASGLKQWNIVEYESDLLVYSPVDISAAVRKSLQAHRAVLQEYIGKHPAFASSLDPLPLDTNAHPMISAMLQAAAVTGVGPMAAVAGAIAQHVARDVADEAPEVIIENGGDIFLHSQRKRLATIYGGPSPLSNQLTLTLTGGRPYGICTSSGTVGHSLSFGRADAVAIVAEDAILADAAATAVANRIQCPGDIPYGLHFACSIPGVEGAVILIGQKVGIKGHIYLA
jgi:uncharacterized protein